MEAGGRYGLSRRLVAHLTFLLCIVPASAFGSGGLAGTISPPSMTQIEIDASSFGSVGLDPQNGTVYTIRPDLQNLVGADAESAGGNLFYRFLQFDLAGGDSAVFSDMALPDSPSSPSIALTPEIVVSTVLDSSGSYVGGAVESVFPGADFYFLNPAGITVGSEASFTLTGSLFLSTADRIVFEGDGDVFEAGDGGSSPGLAGSGTPCCEGSPVAFDFSAGASGEVVFEGGSHTAIDGTTIQVTAGNVRLVDGAKILSPGGEIHLAAVGDSAVAVPLAFIGDAGVGHEFSGNGTVEISGVVNGGTADLAANGGSASNGRVVLRGGQLEFRRAVVRAGGSDGTKTAIDLLANDSIHISSSQLFGVQTAQVSDPGHAGVRVRAPTVVIDEGGGIRSTSKLNAAGYVELIAEVGLRVEGAGSKILGQVLVDADGGDIRIDTGNLVLSDGARVGTEVVRLNGRGGSVQIFADDARLDFNSKIFTTTKAIPESGTIQVTVNDSLSLLSGSEIYTETLGSDTSVTGSAGDITVVAGDIRSDGVSNIRSTTRTSARSGDIAVTAHGSLSLMGLSGIATQPLGTGDAGNIRVEAGSVTLAHGGQIISEAQRMLGSPGDVRLIVAGPLSISGVSVTEAEGQIRSLISTRVVNSASSTDAGDIWIEASSFELANGGLITSRTKSAPESGLGNAGNITIHVDSTLRVSGEFPLLDENNLTLASEISARGAGGDGGSISLRAGSLEVTDGAAVSATSFGSGSAGTITVEAAENIVVVDGSLETERGDSFEGGTITLDAGGLIHLVDSQVESNVRGGDASGGNINIGQETEPRFFVLNNSVIKARAAEGRGGDITISAQNLIASPDSEINAQSNNPALNGEITVNALEQELSGRLVPLEIAYLDVSSLLLPPCAARIDADRSSLTVRGRPGVASDPAGMLPSPILSGGMVSGLGAGAFASPRLLDKAKGATRLAQATLGSSDWSPGPSLVGAPGCRDDWPWTPSR